MPEKQIILINLPPFDPYLPSIALSELKSMLISNNHSCTVQYWNIDLYQLLQQETGSNILPVSESLYLFMLSLAIEYNDEVSIENNLANLKKLLNHISNRKYTDASIFEIKKSLWLFIESQIKKIDPVKTLLIGFSSKFLSWIPAILISKRIKKIIPDVKIVFGGLNDAEAAENMLQLCTEMDFCIWGEGEVPLNNLVHSLKRTPDKIPDISRLFSRNEIGVLGSNTAHNTTYNLSDAAVTDFSDYFKRKDISNFRGKIHIPLESSRGCIWNRCKFCSLNHDYRYQRKKTDQIIDEIKKVSSTYKVFSIRFVDNDLAGNSGSFNILLDRLLHLQKNTANSLKFAAEIIHSGMDEKIIAKMCQAGFYDIQIGYESLCNDVLRKLNKSNSFSDNISVIKAAVKNNLILGINVIPGIPDEMPEDILTNCNNLHYLRFALNRRRSNLNHNLSVFGLEKGSAYYNEFSDEEKRKFTVNSKYSLLPEAIKRKIARFSFFSFTRPLIYKELWDKFIEMEKQYIGKDFNYKVFHTGNKIIYKEYSGIEEIKAFILHNLHREIIDYVKSKPINFQELYAQLLTINPNIKAIEVKELLDELKTESILYFDDDYNGIIALIDL